jgi:hypothetical protein
MITTALILILKGQVGLSMVSHVAVFLGGVISYLSY